MKQFNLALRLRRNRILKTCLLFTLLAVVMLSLPLYANHEGEEHEGGMCSKMMAGKQMMMKSMMQKSVTATSDGGVVIVAGDKITKYDKNLNVVKEIESKMDMESMMKKMDGMMGKCPMMKGDKKMDDDKDEDDAAAAPAVGAEDHAAHH